MRHRKQQRGFRWGTLFLVLFTLLVLSGGTFAALWATGTITFASIEQQPDAPSREGEVAFPAPAVPIPAYTRIERKHLINPQTNQLHVVWVEEEHTSPSMIRDLGEILGRVTARDKTPGLIFTEADLTSKGTRPGLTAAVPIGQVAIFVPNGRIRGMERLNPGDRFDVLSKVPDSLMQQAPPALDWAAVMGGRASPEDSEIYQQLRTGLRTLAHGAVKLMDDSTIDRTAIAVKPQEMTPMLQMVGRSDVDLQAVFHSSQKLETTNDKNKNQPDFAVETDQFVSVQDPAISTVKTPVTTRPVRAFSKLTIADFVDPATGKIRYVEFEDVIGEITWETDIRKLIDRVASRDIPGDGRRIEPGDLLPEGTKSGVVAGVPPGMVAFTVDSLNVDGLAELNIGDEFMLVAAKPFNINDLGMDVQFGLTGGNADKQTSNAGGLLDQAQVEVVLGRGILLFSSEIEIRTTRERSLKTETTQSLHPNGNLTTRTITEPVIESFDVTAQDFVVALSPRDVATLSETVNTGAKIHAVLRTGNPSDNDKAPNIVKHRPLTKAHIIEHIRGDDRKRELWLGNRK